MSDFLSSIRRWIEKATKGSIIKGNLPPFTLTGDYNDAVFPMLSTNKVLWLVTNPNLNDFDHSSSEFHIKYPRAPTIGSWCNYDEAHHYYQKCIDRDILFREFKQKQCSETSGQELVNTDTTTDDTPHYPRFKTNIKKGTTAWDITQNREVLEEYQRRKKEKRLRKPTRYSKGWHRLLNESVQLISDIKKGQIDIKSDEVQGKIGNKLKTKEEIGKLNKLDDPDNDSWRSNKLFAWRQEFIQMKIRNTIEWQQFCTTQANKQ